VANDREVAVRKILTLAVTMWAVACATSSAAGTATAAGRDILPFVEDDFGRAETLAREKHLPLFVDVWAPW
jgi:hypothetical protein